MTNDRVYIHEFIDIRGHHRAKYMHHMTANWSPHAQEHRNQLCYGVWAVLGSTGHWPQVVNIWEEQGWDGLAESFDNETVGEGIQDPFLAHWWAEAKEYRRGGFDRILIPAPWTKTSEELCAASATGALYAHELVKLRPGSPSEFLDMARDQAQPMLKEFGWNLVGAFRTAMVNDDEALLLWAIPSWHAWAQAESVQALGSGATGFAPRTDLTEWRAGLADLVTSWHRILLVDAPLSPFRTLRQPRVQDQVEDQTEHHIAED